MVHTFHTEVGGLVLVQLIASRLIPAYPGLSGTLSLKFSSMCTSDAYLASIFIGFSSIFSSKMGPI